MTDNNISFGEASQTICPLVHAEFFEILTQLESHLQALQDARNMPSIQKEGVAVFACIYSMNRMGYHFQKTFHPHRHGHLYAGNRLTAARATDLGVAIKRSLPRLAVTLRREAFEFPPSSYYESCVVRSGCQYVLDDDYRHLPTSHDPTDHDTLGPWIDLWLVQRVPWKEYDEAFENFQGSHQCQNPGCVHYMGGNGTDTGPSFYTVSRSYHRWWLPFHSPWYGRMRRRRRKNDDDDGVRKCFSSKRIYGVCTLSN